MATVVYWAKAHGSGLWRPMPPGSWPERGQSALGVRLPHGARRVHTSWCGAQQRDEGLSVVRSSPRPSTRIPL
jgi:hypothetical protein